MINRIWIFLVLFSTPAVGQQIYFSFPFQVSGPATGNTHPRVALVQNEPIVLWGDPSNNDNLFYSNWNGNGFDAPVQLTYNDESTMLGYAEGPVIKSKGDSVYVCYVSMGMTEHRVYLRRSFDGGQTFSDTIIVNDRSNGVSLEYANMELDENGNPVIAFIRFETGDVPKHVFYRSSDGGTTFTSEINATPDTASQPCECCPASIIAESNLVYCIYRNNVSNTRDFYVSVSQNGGMSFDSLKRIDFSNWISSSCPASGPSSMFSGDSLISVYMIKQGSQGMIKANTVHKTSLEIGPEYYVDPGVLSATYQMNYPEIAGNGDTIGIVWQDNRSGQVKSYFSYSTTGMSGLSAPVLLSDFISGINNNPHLVFRSGVFHIVWRDYTNDIVWYRKASFNSNVLSEGELTNASVRVFPNPADEYIYVHPVFPELGRIRIMDASGRVVIDREWDSSEKINTGFLEPGIYYVLFPANNRPLLHSLVIQR